MYYIWRCINFSTFSGRTLLPITSLNVQGMNLSGLNSNAKENPSEIAGNSKSDKYHTC